MNYKGITAADSGTARPGLDGGKWQATNFASESE